MMVSATVAVRMISVSGVICTRDMTIISQPTIV